MIKYSTRLIAGICRRNHPDNQWNFRQEDEMNKSAAGDCAQYGAINLAYHRPQAIFRSVVKLAAALNRQLSKGAKEERWHWTIFR